MLLTAPSLLSRTTHPRAEEPAVNRIPGITIREPENQQLTRREWAGFFERCPRPPCSITSVFREDSFAKAQLLDVRSGRAVASFRWHRSPPCGRHSTRIEP